MIFGDSIVLARESRGLDREELAAKLQVSVDVLAAWETDQAKPNIFEQQRLSFALRYPARFFQTKHERLAEWSTLEAHGFTYTCDGCDQPIDGPHDHVYAGDKDYHPWCEPK